MKAKHERTWIRVSPWTCDCDWKYKNTLMIELESWAADGWQSLSQFEAKRLYAALCRAELE